jgi:hypothetical protein
MARIHPEDTVAMASTPKRPTPPDLDGKRCEIALCTESADVVCWSTEVETYFRFCPDHAAEKRDEYDDLEVVE